MEALNSWWWPARRPPIAETGRSSVIFALPPHSSVASFSRMASACEIRSATAASYLRIEERELEAARR